MLEKDTLFISHIHEELDAALALQRFITSQLGPARIEVFLASDPEQIRPGERWLERIRVELRKAKITVLFLSRASIQRPWVNFEGGAAWIMGQVLIPVCTAGLTVHDLGRPYSDFEAIELRDDHGAHSLLSGIAKALRLPPVIPVPPRLVGRPSRFANSGAYERLAVALRPYGYQE